MATPKTRHTLAMTPDQSDQLCDVANTAGQSVNQTALDLIEIGINATEEQFRGNLAEALASYRQIARPTPPLPAPPAPAAPKQKAATR